MAFDPYSSLAGVGGSILGQIFGSGDQAQSDTERKLALQELLKNAPQMQSINLDQYKSAGQYTPQQEQMFSQSPSAMNSININPMYRSAAINALRSMQDIGHQGGMTIQDQANLNKILSQTASQNAGQQAAIAQNFARRGMGGSGFQLAQQLLAQQASANQANQSQTDIAAQAQQRALQALQSAGGLGNQLNSSDFNQQSQIANAQDMINRFNTQNSQGVAGQNTNRVNQAQQYNLQNAQGLSNRNVDLGNQQKYANNNYQRQYYNDQLAQSARVGAYHQGLSDYYQGKSDNLKNLFGSVGKGVGQYFGGQGMNNGNNNNGGSTIHIMLDQNGNNNGGNQQFDGYRNAVAAQPPKRSTMDDGFGDYGSGY